MATIHVPTLADGVLIEDLLCVKSHTIKISEFMQYSNEPYIRMEFDCGLTDGQLETLLYEHTDADFGLTSPEEKLYTSLYGDVLCNAGYWWNSEGDIVAYCENLVV